MTPTLCEDQPCPSPANWPGKKCTYHAKKARLAKEQGEVMQHIATRFMGATEVVHKKVDDEQAAPTGGAEA